MGNDSMSVFNNLTTVRTFINDAHKLSSFVLDFDACRIVVENFDSARKLMLVREIAVMYGSIAQDLQKWVDAHSKATSPVAQALAMLEMQEIVDACSDELRVYLNAKKDAEKRPSKPSLASQFWMCAYDYAQDLDLHAMHA